ncbi:MAG: alpha-hydroxy acid oxidase [Albimonas sp.]|uniref:alpha-hydroxy acid oxidase n=1 Tax=Albimonas sp. TaxID=1872425 RepID=UPI0040579016
MTTPGAEPPHPAATLGEIALAARSRLPAPVWNYLMGGADDEAALGRNRLALDGLALAPRVLSGVTEVSTRACVLGIPAAAPLFLAPIGSLGLLDPGGAAAATAAAARLGIPAFVSIMSQPRFAQVAARVPAPGALVLQLYARGDDAWLAARAAEARDAGFGALCVTVDTAWYARRERDLAARFARHQAVDRPAVDDRAGAEGDRRQAAFDWRALEKFIAGAGLPVAVKGILRPDDARRAVECGAAAVYLSNHGGRQLDHARAAVEALEAVRDAVGPSVELLVDGGFLRGADVLKALALGARAVGLGKFQGLGLAAGGAPALTRALELLLEELRIAMALCGAASPERLSRDLVVAAAPLPPRGAPLLTDAVAEVLAAARSPLPEGAQA